MLKVACFIHSTTLPVWGDEILQYMLDYLIQRPIIHCLDFIYVNNTGTPLNIPKIESIHPKIRVVNYSTDPTTFEIPTIREMYSFAKLHPNYKLLYLHTKGISRPKECITKHPIRSWVDFMLYCTVDKYNICLQLLNVYNTIGQNEMSVLSPGNPPHYSGNFWWTNASYMTTRLDVSRLKDKFDPEFFIIGTRQYCTDYYSIIDLYSMYESVHKKETYGPLIENRLKRQILYCRLDHFDVIQFLPLFTAFMMASVYPGHTIIIVDDVVGLQSNETLCTIDELLHVDKMNASLKPYDITILVRSTVKMTVEKIEWGMKPDHVIQLNSEFIQKHYRPNYFAIPGSVDINTLANVHDPAQFIRKQLYLTYKINDFQIDTYYDEIITRDFHYLKLDFVDYRNVIWIDHSNTIKNDKLRETVKLLLPTLHLQQSVEDRWITAFLDSMENCPISPPSVLISPFIS